MNKQERLKLNEMIKVNNTEDQTNKIRELQHSKKIKEDIEVMQRLKIRYQRLQQTNSAQYEQILSKQCNFIFTNYTDIFNKLKKDELDLTILAKFISVLEKIENSEIDQHEGSYLVGKFLKELYVDSALKKSEALDRKNAKYDKDRKDKVLQPNRSVSWKQYKITQEQ